MKIPKSFLSKKVRFQVSKTHNVGMFAGEKIKKGELILIWGGKFGIDYITSKYLSRAKKQKKHIIQWDEDLYSVETNGDDPNYYINHSCDPNTWIVKYFNLVAKRDIETGEELTVDYSTWETTNYYNNWKCKCGTKKCRLKISGDDWKKPDFQIKYKNHTTPLIEKLIVKTHERH